jgi:hypothetical protein
MAPILSRSRASGKPGAVQILKRQTPELLLDQSLDWIAMEVEVTKIPEHLRDTLPRLLNGMFI